MHALVGSADRKLVSRSGEWGGLRGVRFICASPHAMPWGARGSPRKKRWVRCKVGAALGCPPWGIWGLKAEQGPRRAALSAPTGALFRVSGFGERKCRYHATWYADRAHPGYWIAPLEAPGRNPSRAQVASLPRKAPGISSKKDH